MTREISENATIGKGFSFHITSLNLKNPDNEPDSWEAAALAAFDEGVTEKTETTKKDGSLRYRLMKPLYIKKACLSCHADQGYKIGEVRGGITVNLPFDATLYAIRKNFVWMFTLAIALVMLFGLTLYFFIWRLLARLSKQKAELKALNETKDKFLGMAAHDLRNPLTCITAYTDLLNTCCTENKQIKFLDGILAASKRMLNLIDDLLDVSKIKSGCLDLKLQNVDIADMIEKVTASCRLIGQMKNIVIRHEVSENIGFACLDPEHIRQVIDNLISNSIKFSNAGTAVTVGAKKTSKRLLIWVEDQGIGIKHEELSRLFGEFTTTSSHPTAGEPSHGLGLAIVKRMVEMHEGTIEVESEVNKGTRFTLSFPLPPGDDAPGRG